ncbi:MAG: hypothetical protein V8Q27_01640 [Eubacteriales bacterium]
MKKKGTTLYHGIYRRQCWQVAELLIPQGSCGLPTRGLSRMTAAAADTATEILSTEEDISVYSREDGSGTRGDSSSCSA